jgi:hypothetical protein
LQAPAERLIGKRVVPKHHCAAKSLNQITTRVMKNVFNKSKRTRLTLEPNLFWCAQMVIYSYSIGNVHSEIHSVPSSSRKWGFDTGQNTSPRAHFRSGYNNSCTITDNGS